MKSKWNNQLSGLDSKNVFLVGGAVRDKLLGIASQDRDFVVVGTTEKEMLSAGFQSVGADFPVFLHPESQEEYALARTLRASVSSFSENSATLVDSSLAVTLEEDLSGRDLTINAMAVNNEGQLIDPFGGKEDLNNKVLRHTSEAFAEDPLRVLRIARLRARYGEDWSVHSDTKSLILELHSKGALANLVPERVWKEMVRALGEPHPELFFDTLLGLGVFPEIDAMVGVAQPKEHHPEGDVYVHTMLALKRSAELNCDTETRFAVLTHDFGKAICMERDGNLFGHEKAGIAVIEAFCDKWRIPVRYKTLAKLTSDNHTRLHRIAELQPKKLHKLLIENLDALKHKERFNQFLMACQCDAQGRGELSVNKVYEQADFAMKVV